MYRNSINNLCFNLFHCSFLRRETKYIFVYDCINNMQLFDRIFIFIVFSVINEYVYSYLFIEFFKLTINNYQNTF